MTRGARHDWSDTLHDAALKRRLALPSPSHPEPLALLDYEVELALKREALRSFWRAHRLPGVLEPMVPAPQPRGYRTTTKRKAKFSPRGLSLGFPGEARGVSLLDAAEHRELYGYLAERLSRPGAKALAAALNWTVVRGRGASLAVILNVSAMDARVVRAAKTLAEALQEGSDRLGVRAAFLYLDPTRSEYYLEARRPSGVLSFKRLFGPDRLQVEADGVRLRFPPTVFSQGNQAMLGTMIATARALLGPLEGIALLDLYCGYGLFSLTAGRDAAHVLGVDTDGPAIEAARENAAHLGVGDRARFLSGHIDAPFLGDRLRQPTRQEQAILLDPPRQGTAVGVTAALATRRPARVVHICCGTDEIPREVEGWSRAGYLLARAVPLDLFPGTAALETFMLFVPRSLPA